MNESYFELPSGRLIKQDDIIYVSDIQEKNSTEVQGNPIKKYIVKVTWANRSTEIFEYDDKFICENDKRMLKNIICS